MPRSVRTMMLVWKNLRMVKTGIATKRVSPRDTEMMSDDIDISDASNSAKRSCRQNISEGCTMVGTSLIPCGTHAAFDQRARALVVGERDAQLECGSSRHDVVVPAQAGTHIPETAVCGTMGPRLRGDDREGRLHFRNQFSPGTLT